MVFHWSLNDKNFPHVSTTLPSILVDLNNAVVWMVSPRSLISTFAALFPSFEDRSKSTNHNFHSSITFTVLWQGLKYFFAFFVFHGVKNSLNGKFAFLNNYQ